MTKETDPSATIEAAKKMMVESNDPMLKFVGNNGELIVNVVKEFFNGFKQASAALQTQQSTTQKQTPTPPPFYGTLKALNFKYDQAWQSQARAWEAYIAMSPHGQVDISIPTPTQYSVQPGAPTLADQAGAKNLKDLERLSRVLDGQSQARPPTTATPQTFSGLTDEETARLEEFRKNGGDPLADKIKKPAPIQETEVELTMEQNMALISEKLGLLTNLFNSLEDDKIREYGRNPDKAIEELDRQIQKPIVAFMLGPYKPVIKEVGINEFKQAFEKDCSAKLGLLTEDEKTTFLVKLDAWRQRL
ncbi:hypothetical protein [Candidatus Magnetobacterium casense]|uniref:Uncharacterized protein n=1 Tax=Candidatus Magnetobacterium casense TaxID=1455061 RepID=A0ABS6RUP6_9BACT|nr:hypothetical protein [Candidatus Magnetobacterium casensis]MBV6340355.1 hypothetical protein [Candidatus Magnetobacterium casensis]